MKIQIRKFKTIENLEISIPAKISGGNGIGKSTILEAISFVLTGKDLSGNEFKHVYDNRVDLHDAIADVSYFDSYGNEFQRIVKPIFQTNRAGIEEIKIKRSTECRKNGIPCNDFSDDFADFYKFGTDYFFNQKEDVQRSIFIDLLKSKMPNFDVNAASLKLKELKKSQKIEVDLVKGLQDAQKNTKDVEVPEIPAELTQANAEYQKILLSGNPDAVADVNRRNNDLMADYFKKKTGLQSEISVLEVGFDRLKNQIEIETQKLETVRNSVFEPKKLESTEQLFNTYNSAKEKLQGLEHFETIESYATKYFSKNPVLVENQSEIKRLMDLKFIPDPTKESSNCPLSGEFCETAKLYSEKSERLKFDTRINEQISAIKSHNRRILSNEMDCANQEFFNAKHDLSRAEIQLNQAVKRNEQIESENKSSELFHESTKLDQIYVIQHKIDELQVELQKLSKQLTEKQTELSNLAEPTPEKLPEQAVISDELKAKNQEYESLKVEINKAQGVNENNAKLKAEREIQIKEKQMNLIEIGQNIATLTEDISNYFSNLAEIVKTEFAGDIQINVELLEYVMSRDEYKDCFKITANGKVFPYECNGALQNNLKMQILFNFQRLKDYKGITIMDNCEANTTQPINSLGLNCVLAGATNEEKLTIK
jgi:chromosome segregation ATPase